MDDTKARLLGGLRSHLLNHPGDAGAFLRVIANVMGSYELAQKQKRDVLTDTALRGILEPEMLRDKPVSFTLDAMYLHFPEGCQPGRAPREKACWAAFVERCAREPVDLEWLGTTRGEDVVQWWREMGLAIKGVAS